MKITITPEHEDAKSHFHSKKVTFASFSNKKELLERFFQLSVVMVDVPN